MLTFFREYKYFRHHPRQAVLLRFLKNLLMNIVSNPVDALVNANYIGILAWAIIFGIALKAASETTKTVIENISEATSTAVRWIINLAPFGIMGLIFTTISEQGLGVLLKLWPSDLCTGWNHAVCSTCTESDRYFYLHTPESISAGSSSPERQWSHRILSQEALPPTFR